MLEFKSRLLRLSLVVGTAAVVFTGGGWASYEVLGGPDRDVIPEESYVLAEAAPGVVERSLSLNTSAAWTATETVAGQASGVVTEVRHEPGSEITAGDVLYSVNLEPVVAAEGAIPTFRALSQGDAGKDVAQLQRFLAAGGYFDGEVDGEFGVGVYWAVRAWQQDLDVDVTGSVGAGALLFIPNLPARAALAGDIEVGSTVSPGAAAVELLADSPDFSIALPEGQARAVQPDMAVEIDSGEGSWEAVIADIQTDEQGQYVAHLAAAEGGSICGEDCGLVPLGDPTLLPSTIYVVPAVEGITVPASAVVTGADGQTVVVSETGAEIPVEVIAGADGMTVVDGLDSGTSVRIPGETGEGSE